MYTIDHGDTLDLRDLSTLARECEDLIGYADEETDSDDLNDAAGTLSDLRDFLADLGYSGTPGVDVGENFVSETLSEYGEDLEPTLIASDHFEDYARELAEDCGMIPTDAPWPARHIDWSAAADELHADYSDVTLAGQNYTIRSV